MDNYDVLIVGAGTAGLMLARELGKSGLKTLLLDRKKDLLSFSFSTLGSFIDLDRYQLTDYVVAQKMETAVLYSRYFTRTIKGNGYILDKSKLHEELINSIDSNYVNFKTGVHIKEIIKDASGQITQVLDKNGNNYTGKIIVDASGTVGVISKQVGLMPKSVLLGTGVEYNVKYKGNPSQGHLFVGKQYQGGYGWIFPLQNGRAILGFGTFDNQVAKELKHRLNDILELPLIQSLVEKDNETVEGGSLPITPVLEKFVQQNLVCVGDSVSQVNPIVGEGYKFIFEAAIMASKAIIEALAKKDLTLLHSYEVAWRKKFLTNYKRAKYSQEKIFKYSKKDYLVDMAILLTKLRSDESIIRSLSGEVYD
ncbi:NAD(P)/FAD-dependent oxidoreductase [Wenyingzhuangia aestuarii]|uniref:NAD(P)/FAD-dependent oxidoreductase n=1 Tax=Wenyingzhuangia aestuarii TaxID=1647582 RepID=UPI00143AB86B|nr:NAD(P)/FAD-dependent oxidoreductase [Wenyingzhuangia aestuarii]NJB83203.1 digeranylgeranylglycerophospholipid reductase [Wenyingzhuangia aestuarii]